MGQVIAIVIIVVFLAFMFVPMAMLSHNEAQVIEIKSSLNLSAKALINVIETDLQNLDGIADGFAKTQQQEISINKEKLLWDFNNLLYQNYYDDKVYHKVKDKLILKVLVMRDRFYVANQKDQWSPPYFFTHRGSNGIVHLNIGEDYGYYYGNGGEKIYESTVNWGISNGEKNQLIIDKINRVVAAETAPFMKEGQLAIEIQNPDNKDWEYQQKYQNFNVLEGITFFVIYQEDRELEVNQKMFKYKNYNVVGYTLRR